MRILQGREVFFSSLNTEPFRKQLLMPIVVKRGVKDREKTPLSLEGDHPSRQNICCDATCSTRHTTNGYE